jgi:hypothetical protein
VSGKSPRAAGWSPSALDNLEAKDDELGSRLTFREREFCAGNEVTEGDALL